MPDLHIICKSDNSGKRNVLWRTIEEPSVETECSFLSTSCLGIGVTGSDKSRKDPRVHVMTS